ncbi:hypothetical protein PDL71_08740 [Lacibacter sp. MH-610]|uniref:hypothetical protein n=1 Tax=Lacibacter sp. MH-610 TaxID=3020883 RepID=UPI0038918945
MAGKKETFILTAMKSFTNVNSKVFIGSFVLIVLYTFLGYWAAIIIDDKASEISIINFSGKNFDVFARYPLLVFFIPIQSGSLMLFYSLVDFVIWAFLMERIIYVIRVILKKNRTL